MRRGPCDADLLAALFGAEGGEAEKAQAGDEDSHAGEGVDDMGHGDIGLVILLYFFVEEMEGKGDAVDVFFPDAAIRLRRSL